MQDCLLGDSMAQIGELKNDSEVALLRVVVWIEVGAGQSLDSPERMQSRGPLPLRFDCAKRLDGSTIAKSQPRHVYSPSSLVGPLSAAH